MASPPNPVYARMVRGAPRTSTRGVIRIGIGAGLGGFAGGFALALLAPPITLFTIPLALTALAGALMALSLPASLVIAAAITARFARPEDLALLRLTGLTGRQIVEGYVEGVSARMRVFQAVAMWLPLGLWLGASAGGLVAVFSLGGALALRLLPLGLAYIAVVYLRVVIGQMARIGVAVSLRWPSAVMPAAGAAAALLTAPVALIALALLRLMSGALLISGALCVAFTPVLYALAQRKAVELAAATVEQETPVG